VNKFNFGFTEIGKDGATITRRFERISPLPRIIGRQVLYLDPVIGGPHDGECLTEVIMFDMSTGAHIYRTHGLRENLLRELISDT
jgi:hypothetical protein